MNKNFKKTPINPITNHAPTPKMDRLELPLLCYTHHQEQRQSGDKAFDKIFEKIHFIHMKKVYNE